MEELGHVFDLFMFLVGIGLVGIVAWPVVRLWFDQPLVTTVGPALVLHSPTCYCPSCTRRKRRDALAKLIESYPPRSDEAGQLEWEGKVMNLALAMHAARNGGSIEDYELVYKGEA